MGREVEAISSTPIVVKGTSMAMVGIASRKAGSQYSPNRMVECSGHGLSGV